MSSPVKLFVDACRGGSLAGHRVAVESAGRERVAQRNKVRNASGRRIGADVHAVAEIVGLNAGDMIGAGAPTTRTSTYGDVFKYLDSRGVTKACGGDDGIDEDRVKVSARIDICHGVDVVSRGAQR